MEKPELEVLLVSVAMGHALENFDLVIQILQRSGGNSAPEFLFLHACKTGFHLAGLSLPSGRDYLSAAKQGFKYLVVT